MEGSYLGPAFEADDVKERLEALGASLEVCSDTEVIQKTAQAIADGRVPDDMKDKIVVNLCHLT